MKIFLKKLKAKITGNTPCSFDSKSGHVFERCGDIKDFGFAKSAMYKCSVCGVKAAYNSLDGHFVYVS